MEKYTIARCISRPFDWLTDEDVWSFIAEYSDRHDYDYCDRLYACVCGGYSLDALNRDLDTEFKSIDDVKAEYANEFPKVLASAMKGIANDMETGKLVIKYKF